MNVQIPKELIAKGEEAYALTSPFQHTDGKWYFWGGTDHPTWWHGPFDSEEAAWKKGQDFWRWAAAMGAG